ncbi:MAG: hypothetical protein IJM02_04530 [Clostridia bacterium]|nr:hypothetical protein [Clostridia bacterium]
MNNTRKITALLLAFASLVSLLLTGCAPKRTFADTVGNEEIKKVFADFRYPGDIVDSLGIDYNLKPDLKGLTKKTADAPDGGYIDSYYDKKGNKVYSLYRESGEDRFDYFTKDKNGNEITAAYYTDENGEVTGIRVDCDEYYMNIYHEDDGRLSYYCDIYDPGDRMTFVTCDEENSVWNIEAAGYFTKDKYVNFSSWENIDGETEEWFEDKYEREDSIETTDVSELYGVIPFTFCAGKHKLAYTENAGKREWYMTFDIIVQFDTMEEAEKFALTHKTTEPGYGDDGETPELLIEDITLKFSDEFENFAGFATMEFNDYYSLVISLDDNYEITEFTIGGIQFY